MGTIVGLLGLKGSGKSSVANMMAQNNGFTVVKMADPLKDMLRTLFYHAGFSEEEVEQYIEGPLKEEPVGFLGGKSTRHAMQTLGTEWGRDLIHEDLWVSLFSGMAGAKNLVVCDDCRMFNEADYIINQGGTLIRILGPHEDQLREPHHISEQELEIIPVHHVVTNSSTINKLYAEIMGVAFINSVPRKLAKELRL